MSAARGASAPSAPGTSVLDVGLRAPLTFDELFEGLREGDDELLEGLREGPRCAMALPESGGGAAGGACEVVRLHALK
jgi:hypothetical protein